jgi:hypothetical protein
MVQEDAWDMSMICLHEGCGQQWLARGGERVSVDNEAGNARGRQRSRENRSATISHEIANLSALARNYWWAI